MNLKQRTKQRLASLAAGELAAVAVFWLNFFLFRKMILTATSFISIFSSLLILSFILIQGAVFWWILIKRISKPGFSLRYTGSIYKILEIADIILLGIVLLLVLLNYSISYTSMIALAIWLFAVIEWINYFKFQLSYSINPAVLLNYILKRKLKKSRIAREMEKAESSCGTFYKKRR